MTDLKSSASSPWASFPLDREIVLTRLVDAPRALVFEAWTDPEQLTRWFGPDGFALETRTIDIRPGGQWRFDMIAPDGTRYDNRMAFLRVEAPALLEVDHGRDRDDDPELFRMLVTFDEQSNGKTVVTLRQMHPTRAQRDQKLGFGAVEYGVQTLGKLARHLESAAMRTRAPA
jgi:uncharacterized protein YndB with AHSA1/START domain